MNYVKNTLQEKKTYIMVDVEDDDEKRNIKIKKRREWWMVIETG